MKNTIQKLRSDGLNKLKEAQTLDQLEHIRITFLGRNGSMADLMKQLRELPTEEKRIYGPLLNHVKQELQHTLEEEITRITHAQSIAQQEREQYFDVTASKYTELHGSLHIYTHLIEQLEDIFISMGYTIADGPEVETDFYNFEALNIPADHPARDMQDTFWLNVPGMLLRTQTSNIQIRTMEQSKPPLAIFAPGRVYRNEDRDASHEFMFSQAECLFIDKNVSMGHLLWTAQTFLQTIFESDVTIRVRPGYFPFVEPGVEIDASCPFCKDGCSTCKHTKWIELLGAGLVHPNVLRTSGINPEHYSGFAFGIGLERLAMIKYGINDMRLFKSNKIPFLKQF